MPTLAPSAPMRPFWELSSDGLPEGDRFDAWHAELSAFNDIRVAPEERPAFRARVAYWAFGGLTLAVNEATPLALVRPDAQAAREGLEHDVIVVGLVGESRNMLRSGSDALGPGDIAFGNMRYGYDFRVTPTAAARWLELTCPPDLADRLAELGSGRIAQGHKGSLRARFLARFLTGLARRLPDLKASDGPPMEQALLSLVAAARLDPSGDAARLSAAAAALIGRARAAATIERELASARLTVERVSDLTGIPRTTLYRLFAADDGVASFIRTRRLEALRADLSDSAKRRCGVAQLAEARGFHCLSTLNRAFRGRYGCTPTELRGKAAANAEGPAPAGFAAVVDLLRRQNVG